jgi:hypothetical protein
MFIPVYFMRLTFSTDYALRLLMLVGLESERLVTIEEVADRFAISKNHLMKVAYQLGQEGYLETVRAVTEGCVWERRQTGSSWAKWSARWNRTSRSSNAKIRRATAGLRRAVRCALQ